MATPVLIFGKSGTGKTASLRNFEHDEIALINVLGKPLSFNGKFDSTINTTKYDTVKEALAKTQKKTIVIDDSGYLITNYFMENHMTGKGFNLYNELGDNEWNLIRWISSHLPEDKIVYLITHEDYDEYGGAKPKTIGKLLDEKVCLEGLFAIALRSTFSDGKYQFLTQTQGVDVTKSPMGMFESSSIDNDLKFVDDTIRKFYDLPPRKETTKATNQKENK